MTICLSLLWMSCTGTDSENGDKSISFSAVKENYAAIAYANYAEALADARSLQEAIVAFTNETTAANFTNVRLNWLTARESYGKSEAFRFAGGPIDEGDEAPEGQLNVWPLDEGHIDYVSGTGGANLVNDTNFVLSEANIKGRNEEGGDEAKVSTGYHAIEFLLWGQDLSPGKGAGERAYTDYTTLSNSDRRQEYLVQVVNILVQDLQGLVDTWATDGSYRLASSP